MATTHTTLNGAITQSAMLVTLTAFTNPSLGTPGPKTLLRVDGETMLVTAIPNSPTLQVVRGYNGTAAVAHNTLAPVAYGLTSDFILPTPNAASSGATSTSYGVSGAIAVPTTAANVENFIVIAKATAAAMTLAAPAADQDGLLLVITSQTAAAHTVTATGLFSDGSTTTDVATFAAQKGASVTLQAIAGLWNVISSTQITFS